MSLVQALVTLAACTEGKRQYYTETYSTIQRRTVLYRDVQYYTEGTHRDSTIQRQYYTETYTQRQYYTETYSTIQRVHTETVLYRDVQYYTEGTHRDSTIQRVHSTMYLH